MLTQEADAASHDIVQRHRQVVVVRGHCGSENQSRKYQTPAIRALSPAWNKGRIVGQKRPLAPKYVWAIRVRPELAENHRDLALFNTAIDSKPRGCDLVNVVKCDGIKRGQRAGGGLAKQDTETCAV
ncbi:hypothetical protein [uncultured Roseobacter sp.]|uniref:hypothetical protein n=1 Tax=uncultured Roseobacter sp. TaxID=114847 RepID=UPI002623589E|nr:hypothetical protein [uncultured Roseobacter sp.]